MMSRKNQVRGRRNGADRLEYDPSQAETQSNDPDDAPTSRLPQSSRPEKRSEPGGGEVLGFAQVFARYPLATLVASFSTGFGLGVLATAVFSRADRRWLGRHNLPESLQDVSSGLRRIPGMIAQHLPDSLARR